MKSLVAGIFLFLAISTLGGCGFNSGCDTCSTGASYTTVSCCGGVPW